MRPAATLIMGTFEMTITVEQLKAARALLAWSQNRLAAEARVSRSAIGLFESSAATLRISTLSRLRCAAEGAGIEFIDDYNGIGVWLRNRRIDPISERDSHTVTLIRHAAPCL